MQRKTISIVGLGSMGLGMALSLRRAGHRVFGADLDPARLQPLLDAGGEVASVQEAAGQSDILVIVVLDGTQMRSVLFGPDGWAGHMRKGAVVVACPTVPPALAREMQTRVEEIGLAYLDAPISGGAEKAAQAALSIMASGSRTAFDLAAPALQAMASVIHDLGPEAGTGSAMKAVNQLLAGVHIAAMGEALVFARAQGLDLGRVLEVISQSAGTSWMFENRAPHVIAGDYSARSSINIWPKDLGIVAEIAATAGLSIPLAKAASAQFTAALEAGLGPEDDAAVTRIYARSAGLDLPGGE